MRPDAILNVDITIAKTGQLTEVFDIRQEVYCSMGKLDIGNLRDRFDDRAIHFLGKVNDQLVSSARVIADDGDFEMEKYFNLSPFRKNGKCAEINRLAILPKFRGSMVAYAMFRGFYRFALAKNIRYFCIVATPGRNSRMYQNIGFVQIGNTVLYNELHCPHNAYVLDLYNALDLWKARRIRIIDYLAQPIRGIG